MNYKFDRQRGAALLLMTLILSTAMAIALGGYLVLLSQSTRRVAGQLQSEQAFYSGYAAFSESMSRILDNPGWLSEATGAKNYKFDGVPIHRQIVQTGDGGFIFDMTSEVLGTKRRLQARVNVPDSVSAAGLGDKLDIVLVLDESGSMGHGVPPLPPGYDPATCDQPGNYKCEPMEQARQATVKLVEKLQESGVDAQVSIYTYSNYAQVEHELSINLDSLKFKAQNLPKPSGGTNVEDGFRKAFEELKARGREDAQPVVMLMTDGWAKEKGVKGAVGHCEQKDPASQKILPYVLIGPSDCTELAIDQAGKLKNDLGAIVYTVGLGINGFKNSTNECVVEANEFEGCVLKQVIRDMLNDSATDEDHYFEANTPDDLAPVFTGIAESVTENLQIYLTEEEPI